jgi:hypothetical protein
MLFSALLSFFSSPVYAHGIWGHIHVTGWAIEYTDIPDLQSLFSDPEVRNAALFGAAFTDSGYFPFTESIAQHSRVYAEYTHWEPFVADYIQWMQLNDPPPFTSIESQKRVSFLMGAAAHGLQDEIFDSLFLHRAEEEDHEGQESLDPACDGFLAREGELRFYPSQYIPFAPLLDIYAEIDPEIDAQIIEDSVELMVGLYVNEDTGENTAAQLADLYGENLIWSSEHYLDPDIPGSLQSEIIPTARYMEALWKRLHGTFEAKDLLIATFPEQHRRLNSIHADSAGSWSTAIFGAGIDAEQINARFTDISGAQVPFTLSGTQWGEPWTRLVRLQPQEDLKKDTRYIISINNISGIENSNQPQNGFVIQTPCTEPNSLNCLSSGVASVAQRTGLEDRNEENNAQGCSHMSTDNILGWGLLCWGWILLGERKRKQSK